MTVSSSTLSAIVASCCLAFPAVAQETATAGGQPSVGSEAADFELTAVAGEMSGPVKLSEVTAKGPVVLVVLRGYPGYQCGICARQVTGLIAKADEFAAAGARVLMVYPGPLRGLEKRAVEFLKGSQLPTPFTMLVDPGYKFTNAYDLRWDAPRETAYPSTFVIGKDGKVSFAKISKEHGGRTKASDILAKL